MLQKGNRLETLGGRLTYKRKPALLLEQPQYNFRDKPLLPLHCFKVAMQFMHYKSKWSLATIGVYFSLKFCNSPHLQLSLLDKPFLLSSHYCGHSDAYKGLRQWAIDPQTDPEISVTPHWRQQGGLRLTDGQ